MIKRSVSYSVFRAYLYPHEARVLLSLARQIQPHLALDSEVAYRLMTLYADYAGISMDAVRLVCDAARGRTLVPVLRGRSVSYLDPDLLMEV